MSDDKAKTGGHRPSADDEGNDWSKQFGVTADELRTAIKAVGTEAKLSKRIEGCGEAAFHQASGA